jgi:signal transduction histidine kinase
MEGEERLRQFLPSLSSQELTPHAVTRVVRVVLLGLVFGLTVVAAEDSLAPYGWWALLVLVAAPGLVAPHHRVIAPLTWVMEVAVSVVAVASTAATTSADVGATFPYLAVPAFAAGVFGGALEATAVTGLATVALAAVGWAAGLSTDTPYILQSLRAVVLAAVAALVGASMRRIMHTRTPSAEPQYAYATRLLTQLRTIARQLPGTLDPGSIADSLLEELRHVAPLDRGAVFTASGGGRLEVLTQRGPDRVAWETSLSADTPISEAWLSQRPLTTTRSLSRNGEGENVSALVLPLVTGVRTVGLVVVESGVAGAYTAAAAEAASAVANTAALRLETALLFDEVRDLATAQERQRLAREIHDGVAQELVMVGYGIDNALAEVAEDSPAYATLTPLRAEVTRVITELRLCLFELRSDVDRHGGLASAIAEYARTVGSSAGMRVHLSLDESTARLPASVESELLRIAQEAITNARKHAKAPNLWVGCEVDPPYAFVEVSDDGTGMGEKPAKGRYGLSIMAERAERIRAELTITPRKPTGTTVSVVLNKPVHAR